VSIKTPRLIQDRCGVYYFRLIVPLSWRRTVKKTEIRRSLRTKDAGIAREAALMLSARMEALLSNSKKSGLDESMQSITDWMMDTDAHKMKVRIFKNGGAEIEADTLEEAKEARAIVEEYVKTNSRSTQQAVAALPSSRCGTSLETAKSKFLAERTSTLSEFGTMPKLRGVLKAFISFIGNSDVAMVLPSNILEYKEKMLADKKAATTINDHLVALTGFFDYCIKNKIAPAMPNPARGLQIPGAHKKAESYDVFSQEEIVRIFVSVPYLKKMKLPDFYWGPLIALFTGARAEEIASLAVEQIYSVKGIWIIDILKGKTENAVRRVPIHNQLLELGLVEYCQAIRGAGYKRLFPHLSKGKNGYKKNMCRTFGDYLDTPVVNIVNELKVFHSFRHTVVTSLTDKGVNEGQKRVLVGHDIDTKESAHDDYTHLEALTLPNLQTAINKLDYEGLDLAPLKLESDAFLEPIARRIKQQAEAKKRKAAKAKEKAVLEATAAAS
jgi:integrase